MCRLFEQFGANFLLLLYLSSQPSSAQHLQSIGLSKIDNSNELGAAGNSGGLVEEAKASINPSKRGK